MSGKQAGVVIVGAGHAGGSAAAALRQFGWTGPIVVIGDEPYLPYQRPPLSKAWLKGDADAQSLELRPAGYYAGHGIDVRIASSVTQIDTLDRIVTLADGDRLDYDYLIMATGSRLRQLAVPGIDLAGVLELRTAADADRLKAAFGRARTCAVIGGGYIGLEVAASARALGLDVVIIEREARVLARVSSHHLSSFFEAQHRAHGVVIETSATVDALEGGAGEGKSGNGDLGEGSAGRDSKGWIAGVRLADGRVISCDLAVVGVGALANEHLARAAGLACADGVIVDEMARTNDPFVFAIGDCTQRPLPRYQRTGRLESVPNALEQAKQAAASICGKPQPPPEVPWFWSDQYDLHLQIAGLPIDVGEIVVRGDPTNAGFAVFHLRADGTVQCVEAVNAGAEFMAGKLMIGARMKAARAQLEDLTVPMKRIAGRG